MIALCTVSDHKLEQNGRQGEIKGAYAHTRKAVATLESRPPRTIGLKFMSIKFTRIKFTAQIYELKLYLTQ